LCAYLLSPGLQPTSDPAKPRLVLALDYRGHGQSTYDRNPNNYTIRVALADLSAVLAALEITPAIFVGTSFGGVLAMMVAVLPPIAVAGVILNVIELKGLVRIKRDRTIVNQAISLRD
jgi:pimeloyl-ACP methyl ester carboxylesterase